MIDPSNRPDSMDIISYGLECTVKPARTELFEYFDFWSRAKRFQINCGGLNEQLASGSLTSFLSDYVVALRFTRDAH